MELGIGIVIAGFAATSLPGIVLLARGWRGKRVDDHPICRCCGFDLFGRPPTNPRCSECGSDLRPSRAVRTGNRQRGKRSIAMGLAMLLLSVGWTGGLLYATARPIDARSKPVWWLLLDTRSSNLETTKLAMVELASRCSTGCLTDSQKSAWVSRLGALLDRDDAAVRRDALKMLERMGPDSAPAIGRIIRLLDDTTFPPADYIGSGAVHPIGESAAQTLLKIGPKAVPRLIDAIGYGSAAARMNALVVAQEIDDPSLAEPLLRAVRSDDERTRERAYLALVQGKAALPAAPFIAAFVDPDPLVRAVSLTAIGRAQDRAGTDTLLKGLSDPDAKVRDSAIRVLARSSAWLRDPRAVAPLIQALKHPAEGVRSAAARSLSDYKERRVVEALIPVLKDAYVGARADSAWSLGQIGDAAAVDPLIDAMRARDDAYIAGVAATALGQIGGQRALLALLIIVEGDSPVRNEAGRAIARITGHPFWEHPLWKRFEQKRDAEAATTSPHLAPVHESVSDSH